MGDLLHEGPHGQVVDVGEVVVEGLPGDPGGLGEATDRDAIERRRLQLVLERLAQGQACARGSVTHGCQPNQEGLDTSAQVTSARGGGAA